MRSANVMVVNRLGLHARAAVKLVQAANRFKSHITVSTEEICADAKSILGVLTLAAGQGTELVIETNGPDEEDAVEEIKTLVVGGFGEE